MKNFLKNFLLIKYLQFDLFIKKFKYKLSKIKEAFSILKIIYILKMNLRKAEKNYKNLEYKESTDQEINLLYLEIKAINEEDLQYYQQKLIRFKKEFLNVFKK